MRHRTLRLNITLPQSLVTSLDRMAGPRKRSSFIAQAVRDRIERIQKREMERLLTEGYQALKTESISITKAFEGIAEKSISTE